MSSSMFTNTSDEEISIRDYDYSESPRSFLPVPSLPSRPVGPNGAINCGESHPAQSWSYHNPDPISSPATNLQDLEMTTMGMLGDFYALRDQVDQMEARHVVDYKWKISTLVTLGVAALAFVAAYLLT